MSSVLLIDCALGMCLMLIRYFEKLHFQGRYVATIKKQLTTLLRTDSIGVDRSLKDRYDALSYLQRIKLKTKFAAICTHGYEPLPTLTNDADFFKAKPFNIHIID